MLTTRGLDNRVGAGRMDLNRAYDQLLSGTTDVLGTTQGSMGNVSSLGWDFGQVGQGVTNDYLITAPLQTGKMFTATLTWFRDRHMVGTTSFTDASYDNLDLELWNTLGGVAAEFDFRLQQPLQQHGTLQLRDSDDRPVHVARPLDGGNVRFRRRFEYRTVRPGLVDHQRSRARGLRAAVACRAVPVVRAVGVLSNPSATLRIASDSALACGVAIRHTRYNRALAARNVAFSQRLRLHIIGHRVGLSGQFLHLARASCQHRTPVPRSP